jgi:hypothetical protein
MYLRRLENDPGPLTTNAVLADHRFTNPYRASDRVSQYLINEVLYDAQLPWVDTFARTLLFKMFNRISTWTHLTETLGVVSAENVIDGSVDRALDELAPKQPIYSAAYIMPPPHNDVGPKYRRHVALLRLMLRNGAHELVSDSGSMAKAYEALASYDSIGSFLAYQFVTDLNYSPYLSFGEDEFVIPGPGALRGMRKCFVDPGDLTPADIVRYVGAAQSEAFQERGLTWQDLWGRPLQLIDVQNLFCEFDKYTRVAHPELSKYARGNRIKQRYRRARDRLTAWFPPKWGLNERVPPRYRPRSSVEKARLPSRREHRDGSLQALWSAQTGEVQ